MKLASITLVAILAFAFVPAAEAVTLTVDCGMGGGFLDVPSALTAANPFDVINVHPCAAFNPGFQVIGMNNIQIVGAEAASGLTGAWAVGPGTNPINSPQFFDNNNDCIYIESSDRISIVGLLLEACAQNGIHIINSQRINIQGNAMYNNGGAGVLVRSSRDVTIAGNFISGASALAGVFVDSSSQFVDIQNNRILKNKTGVHARGLFVDITNNEVFGNVGSGIIVENDLSKISRNTVLQNGSGIFPQIDNSATLPDACLVGNETGGGIVPWMGGPCEVDNN